MVRRLALVTIVLTVAVSVAVAFGLLNRTASANAIAADIERSEVRFGLELLAEGLEIPVLGTTAPYRTDQLFVVERSGQVTSYRLDGSGDSHEFLDVGPDGTDQLVELETRGFDERGLLGLAFHPGYAKNGLVYTYVSEPLGPEPDFTTLADGAPRRDNASLSVIREWRVPDPRRPDAAVDPQSSRVLLRIEQPQSNHNAGEIVFGPDGLLYVALGDGGMSDDQGPGHGPDGIGNGQNLAPGNLLGKILRIDPSGSNSANGQYGIPADNPFVGRDGADEIFAYGFRNPFRMSFDHVTGELYAADVGQRDIEEVNLVIAGGNYGWPVKEGTFLFDQNGPDRGFATQDSPGEPADMIDPIAQYDHDEGSSVTGGFVYRGERIPELTGSYVFGDLTSEQANNTGRFFRLTPDGALREVRPPSADELGLFITGFGRDTQGELYVMGLQETDDGRQGQVYTIVPVG